MPIVKADILPEDANAASCGDDQPGCTLPLSASTSSGNRFRILRPWREGGLGKVSVALDEELQREVALKEIKYRHAKNKQSRSRFVQEAKLTGALEHPGIVPVYGLGHYADGRPFYAMRFVRGDSLEEAIDRFHKPNVRKPPAKYEAAQRRVAFRELLGRFIDVCNAVAYAHSRGVLHRDLKPGNVMLGKYGETLVVDWGLAKAGAASAGHEDPADEAPVEISSASGAVPTRMGTLVGTPAYMSPEQAAGRLDLLGPASDVYSLGATLYCLLTGRGPFVENDVTKVLKKVQEGDFESPREISKKIPLALEAICLKAMATKPAERYESPIALADDLEHWLADEPVAAYPEPVIDRVRRWGRRHRAMVAGGAALLVTATIALGIITALIERVQLETELRRQTAEAAKVEAEGQRLEAVAARKTAEENQKVAEQLAKESITRLRALARVHAQAGEWDEAAQDYVNCIDLSADGPTYQAPRKDVCREIAQWDDVFQRCLQLCPNEPVLWIGRAEYRSIRGEWAEAAADYERVIHERPIGDEMVDYASVLVALQRPDDYQRFCREIAARHEEPHDRFSAFLTAWACSIGADSSVDRARVLELASRGVVGLRDKAARLNALALAQYRAGQLDAAIVSLTDSNGMPWGSSETQKAVNWLVLAMANQRLGRAEEAQICLHTARGLYDRARPNLPGEPAELNASEDWVMMNVLLREAESLGIERLDWFAPGTEPEPYAVKFYRWTSRGPHSPPADWEDVVSEPPVDEDVMDVIDYEWRKLGAPTPKCPADYFGLVATASRELPTGDYLIHASADDGVRIWIDDVLVIDEWHWQDGARNYDRVIHLDEGNHAIHIDYFQIDGDATLRFWIRPAVSAQVNR